MKIVPELVNFDNNLPYLVRIFKNVDFDYPVHYHNTEYEITFTRGCEGTLVAGSRITTFKDYDLVMTGPGLPHAWYEPVGVKKLKNRSVTVIHFNIDIFPGEFLESKEFNRLKKLLQNSMKGIQFSYQASKKIARNFQKLHEGQSITNYSVIIEILILLSLVKDKEILSESELVNNFKDEDDERFRNIHSYIIENYRSDIRLADVAIIASLSESAFSHYFKKRTLKSFSEFIIDLRLSHAGYLLAKTGKSITEIAYLSGFNSISNFNNLFRRKNRLKPHDFRKLNKKS